MPNSESVLSWVFSIQWQPNWTTNAPKNTQPALAPQGIRYKSFPPLRFETEHVVKPAEEAHYLAVAPGLWAFEPFGPVAAILTDTGMWPEECFYRLRWELVTDGRNGTILATHGKTADLR